MVMRLGQLPGQTARPPQAPTSSGGWDGGAPMQQAAAPTAPYGGGRVMTPFASGVGGAQQVRPPTPGMYSQLLGASAGSSGGGNYSGYAPTINSSGGGSGGTPSWLQSLMPQSQAQPSGPSPAADPVPLTPQQQMAQNTARGNTLKQTTQTYSPLGEGGMQTNGLGQVQNNGNNHSLNEDVQMAGHWGTANGPLAVQGNGNGFGGVGGGLGGGGGGGGAYGGGAVGDALQSAQDKANAANQLRYSQLLGLTGQLSNSAMDRENQRRNYDLGRTDQDAISAGIGNSTVLPVLEQGVEDQSAIRQNEISDQGIKTAMGVIERRTDQQPDLGLIASLASRPGAVNGNATGNQIVGGGGGMSGTGYGGGGAAGASNFYASLAAANAANNAAYSSYGSVNDGSSSNVDGYGQSYHGQIGDGYMHLLPDGTWGAPGSQGTAKGLAPNGWRNS